MSKILILLHSILNSLRRNTKNAHGKKRILVFFPCGVGDFILFWNSFQQYKDIYPSSEGYEIELAAKPEVLKFYREVVGGTFKTHQFRYEMTDSLALYQRFLHEFNGQYYIIINPFEFTFIETLIISNISAEKKIVVRDNNLKENPLRNYFRRMVYTKVIEVEPETPQIKRFRILQEYLSGSPCKSHTSFLPANETYHLNNRYIVISPGSVAPERCWPADHFAEIINYINDTYPDFKVVLSGTCAESDLISQIYALATHKDKVMCSAGKTSMKEWTALIKHADLLIGNDSGSVHVAAAVRTPSICISGYWHGRRYFPYTVDELQDDDVLPLVIRAPQPGCAKCQLGHSKRRGSNNTDCLLAIKRGQPVHCLAKVTVSDVKTAISQLLNKVKREA